MPNSASQRVSPPRGGTVTVGAAAVVCAPGQSLLRALVALGRRDIPVGCRSGGCGVCRVQVQGDYELGPMSRTQVTPEEQGAGIALACQVFPRGDLHVSVLGKRTNPVRSALTTPQPSADAERTHKECTT